MVIQHIREGEEVVVGVKDDLPVVEMMIRMMYGELAFLEHVFMVGGETIISTIGNSPKGRVVNRQTRGIWHI